MQGKVIVVTGAKGGLGNFVTDAFLAAGATVIGASRSIQQSDFPNDRFTAFAVDFGQSAAVSKLATDVAVRFGRIDALVHVMGGFAAGSVAETDDATWSRMLDLNLNSVFFAARAFIPYLRRSKGRLVVIGSKTADAPHAGLAAYVVSKSAAVTLVRTVAAENGESGVTANIVMPGTMDTPANRKAMPSADFTKWVPPASVADLVVWLAGEHAANVNGAVIPIAGRDV
jgi:NAD(P)-dependent dehydrogenase (short-subunit alcohol dehydrogenase family)